MLGIVKSVQKRKRNISKLYIDTVGLSCYTRTIEQPIAQKRSPEIKYILRRWNEIDKFIVNLIHRPGMVPEYSATVTVQGKEEDIGDKALLTESLDIFKTQQRLAHENGLKVTIQMTYASLFNDEAVEIAKHDHEVYGDEIALSLLGLPCEEFRVK